MKISTISRPRINFTVSHEWIDINGTVAFIGVSAHMLKEIRNINHVKWYHQKGIIEKGAVVAEIHTADRIIPVHAPLNCKFLGPNPKLAENMNLILESPQDKGWVFFVMPLKFNGSNPLLSPENYQRIIRAQVANEH